MIQYPLTFSRSPTCPKLSRLPNHRGAWRRERGRVGLVRSTHRAGAELAGNYIYTNGDGQAVSKIVDGNAESCPINGQVYNNDLDENLKIPGNFYDSDASVAGFVDLDGGDYHLDEGSPAVGAGVNLSDIFTDDFEGNDRGTGPFDLGAYRY